MPSTYVTAGALVVARRRLGGLTDGLGDIDVEDEIEMAARVLAVQIPSLPAYTLLDANHQALYDLATGLAGAANILAPAIAAANDGMAKLKTPEFEYTFRVPDIAERERWSAEIAQAVSYLERLARPPSRPRQAFSLFGAAGVARAREAHRGCGAGGIVRLLVPEGWVYDSWFGSQVL